MFAMLKHRHQIVQSTPIELICALQKSSKRLEFDKYRNVLKKIWTQKRANYQKQIKLPSKLKLLKSRNSLVLFLANQIHGK